MPEYKNLKIKITLKSSVITPFHSDTIFGHLCWGYYYQFGEEDFKGNFLPAFNTDTPSLILSNAFPENHLPLPILPPGKQNNTNSSNRKNKRQYISKNIFKELNATKGIIEENIPNNNDEDFDIADEFLHTAIDRITGSALENKLYQQEEIFYKDNAVFDLYCKILPPMTIEKLNKCLEYINISGFGKDKSAGKGGVKFEITDEPVDFNLNNPNAFMNLSNYIPKKEDPVNGNYDIFTKFGKLGGHFANSSHPFKKPVLMIKPGSTFYTENCKEFYGRVVDNIQTENGHIKHYGISYPIPIKIGDNHE